MACLCIATWAKDQQYRFTALAYTQAAALLRPSDPVLAYRVGRMARDASQYPRAESWLRVAVKLSRGNDWKTYALAYIALANLYLDVGNFPAARSLAHRVIRTAQRHSLPALAGMAYHALFIMAAQSGAAKEAHDLALAAFAHYGQDHPRIPALAHDLASFWSIWGRFERSLPVFRAIARWFPAPDDLVVVSANRARAAAALGLEGEYKTAFAETISILPQCGSAPRKADASLTLARSAASMKEFALAEEYGTRAHRLSQEHGLHQLQMEAEAALDAIKAERDVITGPSEPPSARETGNQLAGALALSLSGEGPISTRLPARSRGLTC